MASLGRRASKSELGSALMKLRGGLLSIALLSACINVLTLGGSLYLMMVYDRVLPAQSLPTLFSLFVMIAIAYIFYGAFDVMRSQMLADIASSLDRRLAARVQTIEMRIAMERPDTRDRVSPTRDLDQLVVTTDTQGVCRLRMHRRRRRLRDRRTYQTGEKFPITHSRYRPATSNEIVHFGAAKAAKR